MTRRPRTAPQPKTKDRSLREQMLHTMREHEAQLERQLQALMTTSKAKPNPLHAHDVDDLPRGPPSAAGSCDDDDPHTLARTQEALMLALEREGREQANKAQQRHLATIKPHLVDAEVKKFSLEPTRAELTTTLEDFLAYAARKHPLLLEWTKLARGPTDKAMATLALRTDLREADAWQRAALEQIVTAKTPDGQLFAHEERTLAKTDIDKASSGVAYLGRLMGYGALTTLEQAKAHLDELKRKQTVVVGASEEKIKCAINNIIDGFNELPKRFSDAHDIQQVIIDSIPDSIMEDSTRTYKERLSHEMDEYRVIHNKDKYTVATLRDVIARRVNKTTAPPSAFVANRGRDNDGKNGDDGGARAKRHEGKRIEGVAGEPRKDRNGDLFTFLEVEGEDDVFCHSGQVSGKMLEKGEKATFKLKYQASKASYTATNVQRIEDSDDEESAAAANEYDASEMMHF